MTRSGKLPVLNLLTGRKSGFSPRRGDWLHRFTSNLAGPMGTWVRLAVQNYTPIGAGSGNVAHKYEEKKSLFGEESPRRGEPFNRFLKFYGFYTLNYPALEFYIWRDSLHRLRSYCWETARRSVRPNFSVHPVGETVLDRKMLGTFFDCPDILYHHAKFGEDHTTRVGCRCRWENVVFVCHAPSRAGRSDEWDIGLICTATASLFMGRFSFISVDMFYKFYYKIRQHIE